MKLIARKMVNENPYELMHLIQGDFDLEFDDGVVLPTNAHSTIYSSFAWEFHRKYPDTPLLHTHHVTQVLGKDPLNSGTHSKLLNNVLRSTYTAYQKEDINLIPIDFNRGNGDVYRNESVFRDNLFRLFCEVVNELYNFAVENTGAYSMSVDMLDMYELMKNEVISSALLYARQHINDLLENRMMAQQLIDETYKKISDELLYSDALKHNTVAIMARSKSARMNQMLQLFIRGYVTDLDSNTFHHPIMYGFIEGLRSIHDSTTESRSATKSLTYQKVLLSPNEYFSRRLQLMTMVVQRLHRGDCGSKHYIEWTHITEKHLRDLAGKYRVDLESGKLVPISSSDKHLLGKNLLIRSPLYCMHPDPQGICSCCFGELSFSVPENTNIGQYTSTSLARVITQIVLSTKHYVGSATIATITMDSDTSLYFEVGHGGNCYLLNRELKIRRRNPVLVVTRNDGQSLSDVHTTEDFSSIQLSRIISMNEVMILSEDLHGTPVSSGVLTVEHDHRSAYMTEPFLRYVKRVGWTNDEKGNYLINLNEWDPTIPMFALPLRQLNMNDYSKDVADILESSIAEFKKKTADVKPEVALMELYDTISSQLEVNVAVIEIIFYATLIVSMKDGNYALPKPWSTYSLSVMSKTMAGRSKGGVMSFEGHRTALYDHNNFINNNVVDHPMDTLVCPEALEFMK